MPTQDKHPSYTRSTGQINLPTRQFINSSTQKIKKHQLINSKNTNLSTQKTPARQLKKSKNLQLTNLKTHQLENLNYYHLFYNIALNFAPF